MPSTNKLIAEAIGTFALVSAVVGAALVSGNSAGLGVALAIGFTVMAMAYAVGPISGGHFNPAVTLGLAAAGRFDNRQILPYWAAQVAGGVLAAIFFAIVYKLKGGDLPAGFASNGYGEHSGGGFPLSSALLMEMVQTALFIFVIARVTRSNGAGVMAPVAIGLMLAAMHIMSIPAANTSLNPARSIATAVVERGWALAQLWLFILAPLIGGVLGGLLDKFLGDRK
ncbi:MAG: aquaporin [Rhizobiales bacterium]|nr:aquaporin [Hyphomicrobiales bacterium]